MSINNISSKGSNTVTNLFGAVDALADTATGLFGTTAQGIGMLSAFVDKHAQAQAKRYSIDLLEMNEIIAQDAAMASAQREANVNEFLKNSPELKETFENSFNKYLEKLQPTTAS